MVDLNLTTSPPYRGEDPILVELALIGIETRSLAGLRQSGHEYSAAIPILTRWLALSTDPKLLEEIVRALSVPWAKPIAARPLIDAFIAADSAVSPSPLGLRWTIGSALEVVADDSVFDDLANLVNDRSFGRAREMIVLWFAKSRRAEAVSLLVELIEDPDVGGHAVKALSKTRLAVNRAPFESMLEDRRSWVRQAARKGLSRLERS
jgi:hypothetical protein